jgi:hypothetical protein
MLSKCPQVSSASFFPFKLANSNSCAHECSLVTQQNCYFLCLIAWSARVHRPSRIRTQCVHACMLQWLLHAKWKSVLLLINCPISILKADRRACIRMHSFIREAFVCGVVTSFTCADVWFLYVNRGVQTCRQVTRPWLRVCLSLCTVYAARLPI